MRSRIRPLLICLLILFIIGAIGLGIWNSNKETPSSTQKNSHTLGSRGTALSNLLGHNQASNSSPGDIPPSQTLPFTTPVPANLTELEKHGVTAENLYKNNPSQDLRSDTTISQNELYSIVYLAFGNEFQINLYQTPYLQNQTAAESVLLNELKISQEQACQLKTNIIRVPEQPKVVTSKLSFCL